MGHACTLLNETQNIFADFLWCRLERNYSSANSQEKHIPEEKLPGTPAICCSVWGAGKMLIVMDWRSNRTPGSIVVYWND